MSVLAFTLCLSDDASGRNRDGNRRRRAPPAAEYNHWPLVLVRLPAVDQERLAELVTDAWRMRAPEKLTTSPGRDGEQHPP